MELDVMRLGSDKSKVSCKFATEDGDGKAGLRYRAVQGELIFEPGETMRQVHIPIIASSLWSSTLEFKVVLSEAEGCELGRYLFECRVKVIDSAAFPSDFYGTELKNGEWETISTVRLIREYFKFNYKSSPLVRRRSIQQVVGDQLINLYTILQLYIGKLVLDKVLKVDGCPKGEGVFFDSLVACPESRAQKISLLCICAFVMVVPFTLVHYLDFRQVFFKLGGSSRKTIQGHLMRKFLNYDERVRCQLGSADLIMAMTRDTENVVHNGYMQCFPLIQTIGRLIMMVGLQLALKAYGGVFALLFYPAVLIPFLHFRGEYTVQLSTGVDHAQDNKMDYLSEVTHCFRLIADYMQRPRAVEMYEKKIGAYNSARTAHEAVCKNNAYVCLWMAQIITAGWFIVGGNQVITQGGEIGTFVLQLAVFNQVGAAWAKVFEVLLKIQESFPYLKKVCVLLNLPVDVEKRMRLNRRRRELGEKMRILARDRMNAKKDADTAGMFAADFVPISLKDARYTFRRPGDDGHRRALRKSAAVDCSDDAACECMDNITMDVEQGTLVALAGEPGSGKSTLMRMIGGQLIPDSGDLLIPPHLRVLHISLQPIFFLDTLYENLRYGVSKKDVVDSKPERVLEICRELKVSDKLYRYLDPDESSFSHKAHWGEILSQTQAVLVNLARAFVANPEVLVLHKPTIVFDDTAARNVFRCVRRFVDEKGLCMDPRGYNFRRPRSVILTTVRPQGVKEADNVYKVSLTGVSAVHFSQVTEAMLK
jgi:ABC-type multidrug transport system fused ATPase/permease subunit